MTTLHKNVHSSFKGFRLYRVLPSENNRKLVSLNIAHGAKELIATLVERGSNLKRLNVIFSKVALLDDY